MAHALAFGGSDARDIGNDRLCHILANKFRGLFLGRATNFTNHHNGFCCRVLLKQTQDVDEVGARNRIATDSNAGRLTIAHIGCLLDGLVGQGSGARHDPDTTRLMDIGRHNTDLALAGRDDSGAIWTNQPDAQFVTLHLGIQHVEGGHALGDTDNQLNTRIRSF